MAVALTRSGAHLILNMVHLFRREIEITHRKSLAPCPQKIEVTAKREFNRAEFLEVLCSIYW